MIGEYDIYMGKMAVGKASVERLGLYYRLDCRCRLTGEILCRLMAECDGRSVDLGILVPRGGNFGLITKVPVKHFGKGEPRFRVYPKHSSGKGIFVEVYPDEPFAYLSRLKNAFLAVQNGQLGVVLTDPEQGPQGSDRSP